MEKTKKTILIVDDSQLIAERLVIMLKELTIVGSIAKASNYTEAVELLIVANPDVVFLDIHLPGRNGIELLKFIKNNYPLKKVIMLTNESGDYYRNLCAKAGAAYFIDKSKE